MAWHAPVEDAAGPEHVAMEPLALEPGLEQLAAEMVPEDPFQQIEAAMDQQMQEAMPEAQPEFPDPFEIQQMMDPFMMLGPMGPGPMM